MLNIYVFNVYNGMVHNYKSLVTSKIINIILLTEGSFYNQLKLHYFQS